MGVESLFVSVHLWNKKNKKVDVLLFYTYFIKTWTQNRSDIRFALIKKKVFLGHAKFFSSSFCLKKSPPPLIVIGNMSSGSPQAALRQKGINFFDPKPLRKVKSG